MEQPTELFFSNEKAVYLFTRKTQLGKGGDKKKYWTEIMGFDSPESIRIARLDSTQPSDLFFQRRSEHGHHYQAIIEVWSSKGFSQLVRTGRIVRHGETMARFVTAFPQKARG